MDVGLHELQQRAGDLVRAAEQGEQVRITVSGRPVATLGPIRHGAWRAWYQVADAFESAGFDGQAWAEDLAKFDAKPVDPWSQ